MEIMPSAIQIYIILFLQLTTVLAGEHTKNVKKIIIHVPYKIHKHHHTHTKYKIIKVPETKKENTIVYLKDDMKPNPQLHLESFHATDIKAPTFSPPHQESALGYFTNTDNKEDSFLHQQYSTDADDQKTLETNLGIQVQTTEPNYQKEQIFGHQKENLATSSFYKSLQSLHYLFPSTALHQSWPSKPDFLQYNKGFQTHFLYYPTYYFPKTHLQSKYHSLFTYPAQKPLQDNAPTTSNQIYKSVRAPKTAYKVKEEFQENGVLQPQLEINQQDLQVPSLKVKSEDKIIKKPMHSSTNNFFSQSPDYEYEHVGYLIIDGNSRRVVGKDFKNGIHLFR